MTDTATKIWTADEIRSYLEKDNAWLSRGIVAIWKKQTEDEKAVGHTRHDNGVGFSGVDSDFLSSLAEQINRGRTLSIKQIQYGRKCMLKYAGQLTKIANGEI